MTLTKREIVVGIAEKTGFNQVDVADVVQQTLDRITEALTKGGKVELRNFGVFTVRVSEPRVGRNPNKPDVDVPIPARAKVKFKPGKVMEEGLLKLNTQPKAKKRG